MNKLKPVLKPVLDYFIHGPEDTRDIEPNRYLNSLGEPVEGGVLKKAWRNYAFVTAVGCGIVAGYVGMKDTENARNMLVTTMCIFLYRRDHERTCRDHFNKDIIIDTKPESGMKTHADDLQRAQMLISDDRFNLCLSGATACLHFIVPSGGIFPYILLPLTSAIAQPLRAQEKVVEEKWVIVPPGEVRRSKTPKSTNGQLGFGS